MKFNKVNKAMDITQHVVGYGLRIASIMGLGFSCIFFFNFVTELNDRTIVRPIEDKLMLAIIGTSAFSIAADKGAKYLGE